MVVPLPASAEPPGTATLPDEVTLADEATLPDETTLPDAATLDEVRARLGGLGVAIDEIGGGIAARDPSGNLVRVLVG